MFIKIFLGVLFSLTVHLSWAQQTVVDSLQSLLPLAQNRTDQANLYYQLAVASLNINPPQAIAYSHNAQKQLVTQDLALKGKIYQIRGKATQYLGHFLEAAQQLDSAFIFLSATDKSLNTINDNRCEIYYLLANQFLYKAPQKAITYTNKILALIPTENKVQFGITYNLQASAYGVLMYYDSSLMFLDSSLHYLQQMEDTPFKQLQTGITYSNIGNAYISLAEHQKGATFFYKAMDIYDRINKPTYKATTLNNLSAIYTYLDDPLTAIQYVEQSIQILEQSKDTLELCNTYYNLSVMYGNDKRWDTALAVITPIIPFYIHQEQWEKVALCYIHKSYCYNQLNAIEQALYYSAKAEELRPFFHSKEPLYQLQLTQASLYRKTGQLDQSKTLYQLLIDSFTIPAKQIQALKGGIKTAILLKDFETAYHYTRQITTLKDSLAAANETKVIRNLEIKYETKELNQQNLTLKKEQAFQQKEALQNKRLLYLTIGVSILLLLLLLLFFQYKTVKNNYQTRELKHQLLRNQMNPHFLFNVLGAIQSFIYTNNPIKAGDFLSSFATLVRAILDNSTQEYVPISKEIDWLKNYISLQALRFGEHLDYTIDIDPILQNQEILIPPMLIQPIIENALEHGFKDIDYQGHLYIKMSLKKGAIEILIKDNGIGFAPNNKAMNTTHVSHATRITKERIDLLNKKNAKNITFETLSTPQKGTTVNFHLPFEN